MDNQDTGQKQHIAGIVAIDIGGGTQDILLWDPRGPVENCVKLVLPAPTVIVARRIQKLTAAAKPIYLAGDVMGGGACTQALLKHLARGCPVFASEQAALTIADNLDRVRAMGVEIVERPPGGSHVLTLGDIDLDGLTRALEPFEVTLPSRFAVAVQDHGFSPHASNRQFRFRQWEEFLAAGGSLERLWHHSPPTYLTRMQAVQRALPGAVVMDTGAAAILGALCDPFAAAHQDKGLTVVNLGNQHAVAALVRGHKVYGIYEHHTGLLDGRMLDDHLRRFRRGELTHAEVFQAHGHGCATAPKVRQVSSFEPVVVTGPQRRLAADLGYHFAAPYGDMMLTGCFGLVRAVMDAG